MYFSIKLRFFSISHKGNNKITEYRAIFFSISHKGNNKITEHRAIFQRERQNSSQQTDKISQQPENWENRNGPDLVQAFPKK